MYFDRFDIVEAWYLALSDCHAGQWSDSYARLCKLEKYYDPSPFLNKAMLSENGKIIYEEACRKILYNELKDEYDA